MLKKEKWYIIYMLVIVHVSHQVSSQPCRCVLVMEKDICVRVGVFFSLD
nr:MAG TPA: hypothetical protein [Caudoviricetes sp.]